MRSRRSSSGRRLRFEKMSVMYATLCIACGHPRRAACRAISLTPPPCSPPRCVTQAAETEGQWEAAQRKAQAAQRKVQKLREELQAAREKQHSVGGVAAQQRVDAAEAAVKAAAAKAEKLAFNATRARKEAAKASIHLGRAPPLPRDEQGEQGEQGQEAEGGEAAAPRSGASQAPAPTAEDEHPPRAEWATGDGGAADSGASGGTSDGADAQSPDTKARESPEGSDSPGVRLPPPSSLPAAPQPQRAAPPATGGGTRGGGAEAAVAGRGPSAGSVAGRGPSAGSVASKVTAARLARQAERMRTRGATPPGKATAAHKQVHAEKVPLAKTPAVAAGSTAEQEPRPGIDPAASVEVGKFADEPPAGLDISPSPPLPVGVPERYSP
jgi:hypothetical protein